MPRASPPLWKASVTVAKDRAADAAALLELVPKPDPQAVLVAEDPFGKDSTVEALYAEPPDGDLLARLLGEPVTVVPLPDSDWIRQSEEGLPPVRAGRLFIFGVHDAGLVPTGAIPIRIEAGLAFGTGHHETTALCLAALLRLSKTRRFGHVLDLGCGTGILAIAAAKLLHVPVLATDIDPVAVAVARENVRANAVLAFVRTVLADGLVHPAIDQAQPFDLVFANILAGPLAKLAPGLSRRLKRGGVVIMSGLLRDQERLVVSAGLLQGLRLLAVLRNGPWSALVLQNARG